MTGSRPPGFPIRPSPGSQRVCRSPELIAAYHGLHRLRVPRHPPHAFVRLTTYNSFKQSTRDLSTSDVFDVTIAPPKGCHTSNLTEWIRQSHDLPLTSVVKQRSDRSGRLARHAASCQTIELWDRNVRGERLPRCFQAGSRPRSRLLVDSGKEVIQPQVPLRLPCYDFAPVTALAFGRLAPCGFRHGLRALPASMA